MKAAILKDKYKIDIEEIEIPSIKPDEVLVKVEVCGICGSDIHAFTDLNYPPGTIMGHEFSGTIVKVGAEIKNKKWSVNKNVVIRPCGVCGECYSCLKGDIAFCPTHMDTTLGLKRPGAYAEYVAVPEYMLYELPDSVTFEQAAQLEPVTVCLHAVNMAEVSIGDNIVIFGAGPIGLLIYQVAKLVGANDVYIVEKSELRRDIAKRLGANKVFHPDEFNGKEIYSKLPKGGFDIIFECAGVQATIDESFDIVRKGGKIILVGISPKPVTVDHFKWIVKGIDVKASIAYFAEEFQVALELLKNNKVNVDILVSDIIKIDDVVEKGFKKLLKPEQSVKVLIKPY